MNSVFEANSLVVKLARVYPPEAAPKATRAVLGNLFEEARAMTYEPRPTTYDLLHLRTSALPHFRTSALPHLRTYALTHLRTYALLHLRTLEL